MKPDELAAAPTRAPLSISDSPLGKYRAFQEVANAAREMVLNCAVEIGDRIHVRVEGWTTVAALCDCIAEIEKVENVPGEGVRAIAILKRTTDLAILSRAEGFVGCDEPDWYGGEVTRLDKRRSPWVEVKKTMPKRLDFAIRAMAQTRAISRVLRGPFSFVITMIDKKLSTTPAEEVVGATDDHEDDRRDKNPEAGKNAPRTDGGGGAGAGTTTGETKTPEVPRAEEIAMREQFRQGKWRDEQIHFGQKKDTRLGDLSIKDLRWWVDEWRPRPFGNNPIKEIDFLLRAALDVAGEDEVKELEKFRGSKS